MSLVQRVTAIEGTDREPVEPDVNQHRYGTIKSVRSVRSLRRVISYDVFPNPEESPAVAPSSGVAAYKVSAAKRIGMRKHSGGYPSDAPANLPQPR